MRSATRSRTGPRTWSAGAVPGCTFKLLRRRLRFILLGAILGSSSRRWMVYLAASAGLRRFNQLRRGAPEVIYVGRLRTGAAAGRAGDEAAPGRLATRRRRKAVEADARAELGG